MSRVNPVYFETRFAIDETTPTWPREFVIITAYATTGQQWTDEENRHADIELFSELDNRKIPARRITGYSPSTGHAEASWLIECDLETGFELGRIFLQDAIYYVADNTLYVSRCDDQELVPVGEFRDRVDRSN